jgi:hypothetical protein
VKRARAEKDVTLVEVGGDGLDHLAVEAPGHALPVVGRRARRSVVRTNGVGRGPGRGGAVGGRRLAPLDMRRILGRAALPQEPWHSGMGVRRRSRRFSGASCVGTARRGVRLPTLGKRSRATVFAFSIIASRSRRSTRILLPRRTAGSWPLESRCCCLSGSR